MSVSDPVADYLGRIRNAISAGHEKVDIPASKLKIEMTRICKGHSLEPRLEELNH